MTIFDSQLLHMIDSGEGIDISGISDKPLVKCLKKLFRSLRLKESASGAYLLPQKNVPTLDIVGPVLLANSKLADNKKENSVSPNREELPSSNFDVEYKTDITSEGPNIVDVEEEPPKRRYDLGATVYSDLQYCLKEMMLSVTVLLL
jgi:hypothetical protein